MNSFREFQLLALALGAGSGREEGGGREIKLFLELNSRSKKVEEWKSEKVKE